MLYVYVYTMETVFKSLVKWQVTLSIYFIIIYFLSQSLLMREKGTNLKEKT